MGYVKELALEQGIDYRDRGEAFFGPGATMVIPEPPPKEASHVTGEYPQHKQAHKCRSYWRAPFDATGEVTGIYKVRYEAWRQVPLKNGGTLHCSACWHERVVGFARHIERISLFYMSWERLRYLTIPTSEYRKLTARIKKHNQRLEGGGQVNYASFAQRSEKTVILHDAPEYLGGDVLPSDRPRLYALVATWAATPKGKRAGRGLSSWGIVKSDDDEKDEGKGGGRDDGERKKHVGYIYGARYGVISMAVAKYLDIDPHGKATKTPGLKVGELIDLLDTMGREYEIDGVLPDVHLNTSTPKNTSAKVDTPRQEKIPLLPPDRHEGDRSRGADWIEHNLSVLGV